MTQSSNEEIFRRKYDYLFHRRGDDDSENDENGILHSRLVRYRRAQHHDVGNEIMLVNRVFKKLGLTHNHDCDYSSPSKSTTSVDDRRLQKRMATSSGKKGADYSRIRLTSQENSRSVAVSFNQYAQQDGISCRYSDDDASITRLSNSLVHDVDEEENDDSDAVCHDDNLSVTGLSEEEGRVWDIRNSSIELARRSDECTVSGEMGYNRILLPCDLKSRFNSFKRHSSDSIVCANDEKSTSSFFRDNHHEYIHDDASITLIHACQSPIQQRFSLQSYEDAILSEEESVKGHKENSNNHGIHEETLGYYVVEEDDAYTRSEDTQIASKGRKSVAFDIRQPSKATRVFTYDSIEAPQNDDSYCDSSIVFRRNSCFRMPPIPIHATLGERHLDMFKSVLSSSTYSPLLVSRLRKIVTWIKKHENNREKEVEIVGETCHGVVSGLSMNQVHASVIALLDSQSGQTSNQFDVTTSRSNAPLLGGTLIVLPHKVYLEDWQDVLRKKSTFSVFNQGNLSPSHRKDISISRVAGYDVVLTTVDCIKAKERTYPIGDALGNVLLQYENDSWFAVNDIRRKCVNLSRLHGIKWRRLIFIDFPEKSCYFAKEGTLKFSASVALNGLSR